MSRDDYMPPDERKTFLAGLIGGVLLTLFLCGLFVQGQELCTRQVKEAGERAVYTGD